MKQARIKRSLALLLAVVMCIGLLPMGALAARIVDDEIAIHAPGATEDATLAVQSEGSSDETDNIITPTGITAGSEYDPEGVLGTGTVLENVINGSGMSGNGLDATASSQAGTFWHTQNNPGADAWIQVDLGQIYQLDELWIWNMNQNEGHSNRGFKNVKIEYATDDTGNWTVLNAPADMTFTDGDLDYPFQFAKASGADGQRATNLNDGKNTPVKFNGAEARYVKISANPNAGNGSWGDTYYGLSELRFTKVTAAVNEVKPVHYYTFDEAADATATDSGTGKASGIKNGTVGSVDGKAGKAAQFDGANTNYIEVDDTEVLNGKTFTVTAWVNWDGTGKVNTVISNACSGEVENSGMFLYVKGASDGIDADGVIYAGGWIGSESGGAQRIKTNEWTHVAIVRNGTSVTFYVNGKMDATTDKSDQINGTRKIFIGANHSTGATSVHNFHGAIDELKIFDQALTADQIAAAMKLPEEIPPENSSLKTHEVTILDADWGKKELTIEANLVDGDSISKVTNAGSDSLTGENGMSNTGSTITLNSDFFKAYSEEARTIELEVTFGKGNKDTFTIKRGDPTKRFGWSLQKQATGEDVAIPEGWITKTENGISVNHSKMIVDSNHQPWVIYYADGDKLTDSVWEFDMTLTNPDSNQEGFINIAPAPRTVDGNNYEGFAIDTPAALQRTGRKDGSENYAGVRNEANLTFEYGTTYHFRIVTEGNHMTTFVTVGTDGEEQKLIEFDSPIGLGASTCGFRIWRGGKTIKIENMTRKKLVKTGFENTMVQIEKDVWGTTDAALPYNCEEDDSIQSVANGSNNLTADTDYMTTNSVLTVKKEYIASQAGTFSLKVTFANGHEATLWFLRHETGTLQEYIWTPDEGVDSWVQLSGDGTIEMGEDKAGEEGLHIKGRNLLVNTLSPMTANGEVELTLQLLSDSLPWAGAGADASGFGVMFRGENASSYQTVATNSDINAEPCWDFGKNGSFTRIIWDGHHWESMESVKVYDELQQKDVVKDIKFKVRYYKDSITIWIDDEFCHTQNVDNATEAMGQMGLVLGGYGDILVKKAVFREVAPFEETKSTEPDITIEADGLTVRLDGEFPRVIDYTLNGKKMNGAELSYHYATVNNTDYPATATATRNGNDSVTYHVVPDPERTGVTFDVKFTVKPDHILEMLILNIREPRDEMVFGIGLPQLPMISANSGQTNAALNVSWIDKNNRCYKDRNVDITQKNVSTTAAMGVTLPIVSADGLSASMFNNVLIGGDEYNYKGFELADGKISVGVWNTEWVYRGMDNKKMMPFPSEPDETELYCRVVITEDTNNDGVVNWQDGGNALKKLTDGITPGADQAARSFFHVGYNFSSGTQQPFLQVADNMKRLSNLIDGFGQQLIFKGYANEGHDSGHSDFQDINRRAGGAEDMNVAIAEADKINSNLGIHINEHEIYPEAKMFNDHTAAGQDAWYWMDHSKILRRYVDMLDTTMENNFTSRMKQLFEKTPDLDFVYVDCWGEDRWGEKKLIGTMLENGAELFGNENAADFTRFGVWTHSTAGNSSAIHQFVYNSQKDIYGSSGIYWGGYNRAASMMSWQHNNNINTIEAQFFTNQLPQKYLMCHDIRRIDGSTGYFTGNITSGNYIITKDGHPLTAAGQVFIPWYAENSTTKDPDEAAKIYHWNSNGGNSTWYLPESWNDVTNVYLYKTTQTGKVLVDTLTVNDHQVTINATANTGYVLYPAAAEADVTDWSTGSHLKDTMFNSRDFSIWQKGGEAEIAFNDDGNGVSILTISGTKAGQVSQTMTGLEVGQKYRVAVWAGAANGKTAHITVKQDGKTYENYVDQVMMNCNYFDDYALGKSVQRMWVDFTATSETAEVILSGDACESGDGKATFMQSRMVKTAEPDLPKGCVANETFEYVEQGAYGIFSPEVAADGGPHLSETHLPYTTDTITGDWSLKLYGARGQGAAVRTNPSTMRLKPNTVYVMEFNTLGNGWVQVVSESDSGDVILNESTGQGSHSYTFTTKEKTDYIVRVNCSVLDDFVVYEAEDNTPPTAPANLTAETVDNDNAVILTWEAATDDDGQIGGYKIYRNGGKEPIAVVRKDVLTYTDRDTLDETEYTYQVSAVNLGQTEGAKSNEAVVTTKVLPPQATAAQITNGETITVTFNKAMDQVSAETAANYTLSGMAGAKVFSAALSADGRTVVLTIDNLDMTGSVTVTVANVKDATSKGTMDETSFTCSIIEHYFKLDETAGTTAVDETRHQNGTKLAGVTSVEGKYGQAANFNGKSYIEVASDALYRPDAFTVSAWIKWDGSSGVNAIVGNDVAGNGSSVGIIFFVDGGSGILRTNSNLCAVVGSSNKKVTANEWHHVAFVKNVGSAQVYLDGEMIGSDDVQFGKEPNTPIRIGGSSGQNPSYPFHGAIDEVKIFNVALTEDDILNIATEGMPPQLMEDSIGVTKGFEKDTAVRVAYHGAGLVSISEGENVLTSGDYTATRTGIVLKKSYLESLAVGEHTLTLTFDDEASTMDELTILVEKRAAGIYLSERFIRLDTGNTLQLTAAVVTDGESPAVTWVSSDSSVATVDETGKVTAVKAGTAAITATAGSYSASATVTVNGYLRSWYDKPASNWAREALPIGNGNMGGMVFGKTDREQVQVNEITLWAGGPKSTPSYTGGNKAGAANSLKSIQDAMFAQPRDQFITGVDASALLGNETGCAGYQNLGDITMDYIGAARTTMPENYLRELNVDDSVVRVSYDSAGVHFTREYFASYPGNVMAIRLTADQENALGFTLAFTPDNSNNSKTFTTTARDGSIFCQGKVNSSQMAFAVQLKVIAPGATLVCNDNGTITVTNGEEVLILMSAGTNYDITESKNIHNISDFQTTDGDYLDNNDPDGDVAAQKVAQRIDAAAAKTYGTLLQEHMDDYHEIYGRVTLELGDQEKAELTTDALLKDYQAQRNSYAEQLLFQYGRYLLLSSSRDSLPANLQGIWNNSNSPGWNSDYHFNVNLQMNYWPAFVTNMAETAQPLVTYLDSLRDPGNVTAREHFGTTHGWVVNTEANPFGKTAPGSAFNWGFTPGSGAWACLNLWDYYEFTQDPEVLEQIYPILKESAQFWLEYLVEDPRTRVDGVEGTGELVTAPGGSSEHGGIGVGTTYDMSLAYMEMQVTMEAAKLLGQDSDLCVQIQSALDRMHPFSIGTDGQLKEWREETGYSSMPGSEALHRHLSHLLALQPGYLITEDNSEFSQYYDAAVKALQLRDDGASPVGWSTAQKGSMFARIGDGETALHYLNLLLKQSIASNLLDIYGHPQWGDVFQIEANMGYTAAVAEMLLQSHQGYIEPLPALPEDWADGSYTGLVARGNFETDAQWANGSLSRFAVRSGNGGTCVIRYPNISKAAVSGASVTIVDENTIQFATTKGGEYVITGIPEYHPVKSIEVTSPSGVTLLEKEGQTIQLAAAVAPDTATNREITWKVMKADGTEPTSVTIDPNGLLTATGALARETVRAVATAKDGSRVKGELQITVATDRASGGVRENVALNRPVTMTGATIYGRDDLKLSNINDGSRSTRMAIAGNGQADADVVFEFELDGQKEIDQVKLYEYLDRSWGADGRIDNLAVRIPDGESWKTVATAATPDDGAGNGSRQLTLTFDPVVAERVRVIATDNEKKCPSIWEVEVYGNDVAVAAADKNALITKLGEAAALTEINFTEEDWLIFARTKADAIAVVNNPTTTQNEVDVALAALIETMEAAFEVTVELNQTSVSLKKAGTVQLTCTVIPGSVASNGVTWTSSNTNVATVDENGMVTGVGTGIATITATVNGTKLSVTCGVTVTATSGNYGGSTGDGSFAPSETAKTETRDDGSKVTTVTKPDNSKTVTVEQPDGTKSETVTTKNGDVTITVTDPEGEKIIKVEIPATISEPKTRFEDVPEGHWADEAIHKIAALELVKGVGDNKFDMDSPMTRGALATVLHRLSQGKSDYGVTFEDVAQGKYYTEAVAWAAKAGVVKGMTEELFAPDQVITREQLAVMLCRYARLLGMDTTADTASLNGFTDGSSTSDWAADSIAWCVENGILKGMGNDTLAPTATATRAQVAVMLQRFIDLMK